MNIGSLVETEFNTTSFRFIDDTRQFIDRANSPSFRVRHQRTRAQNTAQFTNFGHHIGGGDRHIEISPAAGDLGDHFIVIGNKIRSTFTSFGGAFALSEDHYANCLTQTVWQHNYITNLLVSLAWIKTSAHVYFNGRVKFCIRGIFCERDSFAGRIEFLDVYLGESL